MHPYRVDLNTEGRAIDWIAPNCPRLVCAAVSRMTATRVTAGAICLMSSSHLALMLNSGTNTNPVMLPPGRAILSTKPWATGSTTAVKTIGRAEVAFWKAARSGWKTPALRPAKASTIHRRNCETGHNHQPPSGCRRGHYARQPSRPPANPEGMPQQRVCPSGSSADVCISTAMRRICSGCAYVTNGQAAALPRVTINSRRLIGPPETYDNPSYQADQ